MKLVCLLTILSVLTPVHAQCQKDSCYNAVAISVKGGPNLRSRTEDCKSVLKTVVQDQTRTITQVIIVTSQTSTVTTQSDSDFIIKARRAEHFQPRITEAPQDFAGLLPRDQIIVNGKRPTYASACKNVQSYGLACLCFGVKAAVNYPEKTSIIERRLQRLRL